MKYIKHFLKGLLLVTLWVITAIFACEILNCYLVKHYPVKIEHEHKN